jgi:hypothetical protein
MEAAATVLSVSVGAGAEEGILEGLQESIIMRNKTPKKCFRRKEVLIISV